MLNVTIQNDGKIKIQSECSNTKEMRHNVNLLLAVVSSMETEEAAADKEANDISEDNEKYDLVLTWVDQNCRLPAVREIKTNLDFWLIEAKDNIDSYCNGNKPILLTGNKDEITKAAKKFDDSEYLKVCVSKH